MLRYLETKPCERCVDDELCHFARDHIRDAVRHVNFVAALARRRLPDADVVLDCHSFTPKTRRRR